MNTNKKTAIIVGVLFITATVTYMIGSSYLDPILDAPDYLVNVSANKNLVLIGMLFELVNNVAVVCIPFMMFPILKKHNEALSLGYVVFRIVESVTLIIGSISILSLVTLSQEFVKVGAPDAAHFLASGTLLLADRDWTVLLGVNIVFPLGSLIYNYLLYRSKLIPRWLSGWGFVGAALLLPRALMLLFGDNTLVILTLPIWVQEMVFALWLIVKGFNPSAIASEPV
ncbi:MAG: DUF4386 domain-containing protein [Chloroflexi bacterium]|nr:DUF4386 domain-containing protein [Chloroflexota bacterium]